jgi:hypothetical protein
VTVVDLPQAPQTVVDVPTSRRVAGVDRAPSSSNPRPNTQHTAAPDPGTTGHRHTRVHDPDDPPGAIHRKLFAIMLIAVDPPTT